MKTNHYESVVITNAALEDEQIEVTLARIEETIKSNGGEITDIDRWGRKRLAYPIQKAKSGYYTVYRFIAPRDLITTLERVYRLDENIIRFLTIVLDKKALEHYERMKEESAKSAASERSVEETNQQNNESKE